MADSCYPLVPMSDFLRLRKDFFAISDAEEYQLVTVQLHARGIKERSRLLGEKIKTKRQQRIKANDLLVAEIDAKVGGYGIVPAEEIAQKNYDLSARNPNRTNDFSHRPPEELAADIADKQARIAELIEEIQELLAGGEND